MSHIVSYVKRQQENTFGEVPFNEVDALVLSQFIYLKLDGLIPTTSEKQEAVYLYNIANHLDYEKVFMDERYRKDNIELFEAMVESKRYRRMRMNYFSDITSLLAETQFSAMTVFLEEGPAVVIYRGTDETMVGWKEGKTYHYKDENFLETHPFGCVEHGNSGHAGCRNRFGHLVWIGQGYGR